MVIYHHKEKYSISEMCRFFQVSRSGYYGYVSKMDIPAWDLPLAEKIRECQNECGKTHGYRRVHTWLERHKIYRNPKTVLRVMQKYGLAENFFSILKTECIYRVKLQTYEEARLLIGEYIYFYNHQRIQLKTKLTPFEKRCQFVA